MVRCVVTSWIELYQGVPEWSYSSAVRWPRGTLGCTLIQYRVDRYWDSDIKSGSWFKKTRDNPARSGSQYRLILQKYQGKTKISLIQRTYFLKNSNKNLQRNPGKYRYIQKIVIPGNRYLENTKCSTNES